MRGFNHDGYLNNLADNFLDETKL